MNRLLRLAFVAALALALSTSFAVAGGSRPNLLKPPKGKYVLDGGGTGGFSVKKKRVSGVKITPGTSGNAADCGTGAIRVKGKHKLSTTTRAGFSSWIVGRHNPRHGDGFTARKATFVVGGEQKSGTLRMIFDYDNVKKGRGDLRFGSCFVQFHFKKKR